MTITEVLERLAATADARAYVFGPDDSSSLAALEMREAVADLWTAARLTLEENAHLADGDQCTLKRLRDAVIEGGESPSVAPNFPAVKTCHSMARPTGTETKCGGRHPDRRMS